MTVASDLSVTNVLVLGATIAAGVSAALGLASGARAWFSRTIGRRRAMTLRLRRLGTGAQLAYFESVLGESAAIRHRFEVERPDYSVVREGGERPPLVTREYVLSLFVNPLCYVQMVSDETDAVAGYSVTTRSTSFHPTLWFPLYRTSSFWSRLRLFGRVMITGLRRHPPTSRREWIGSVVRSDWPLRRQRRGGTRVELGRTTFKETESGWPRRIQSVHANKHWSYTEAEWRGNPGYYQHLVLAASRASPAAREPEGIENIDWTDRSWRDTDGLEWVRRARSTGVITTMAVIGIGFEPEEWPIFGPVVDETRTVP
jgi:hypothetical protein